MNHVTLGLGIAIGLTLATVALVVLLMWSAAQAEADDVQQAHEERWSG